MPAVTTLLGLVTPTQGTLSGTWGDTVNYGISDYLDIAIAGTLSFAGDGAITLANTTGSSSGNAIVSTTAQYMVIRITGTQTVVKVITGPSYSKLYMVDHAGATSAVTFKASGQTGVSIAVGEKAFVYYNGTDYVKVANSTIGDVVGPASSTDNAITRFDSTTGKLIQNSLVTVADDGAITAPQAGSIIPFYWVNQAAFPSAATYHGAWAHSHADGAMFFAHGGSWVRALDADTDVTVAQGGTGLSSGTSGGVLAYTASGTLASSGVLAANKVVIGGGAGVVPSTTTVLGTAAAVTTGTYIQAVGYADTVVALGNTGTAINLDLTGGNVFTATLTGNATITVRYPVATGASSFTLILTNDATASRTITYAGGTFKFPGGAAALSRTTTANAIDVWFFFTPDGGTTYFGSIPLKNLTT